MKLLLPDYLMEILGDRVCQIAPDCVVVPVTSQGEVKGDPEDTEILFLRWGLDRETFRRLVADTPNLRWIHTISAGVEHVLFPELIESDIVLTNASGVFNTPIAEAVLGYMLAVAKRLPEFLEYQRLHRWQKLPLKELRGQVVGIVGLGDMGTEVARLSQAFGMSVLGLQRQPRRNEYADETLPPEDLHDLLGRSDFVVIAAPLTEETRGMIGRPELRAMKQDAWLINIARGPIVDQEALVAALQEERIGGACLDVFVEEPLPADSPLWDLPNVIITPHNSWSSPCLDERAAELFLENLRRFAAGEPLLNVVDKRAGY
jgi:phosphoglycerate dehydrogenase-like enzyme